ncbi:MAG TPA: ferredoxin family protein [Candidatus Hydrogenedentes bacterium]|nr:ferredoxin family protein [Candidatus Hydrogenedentota bacterium]
MNSIEIDSERCKGCYLCIEACPRHLIAAGDRPNAAGYYSAYFTGSGECTACALCATVCPDVAITVFKNDKP